MLKRLWLKQRRSKVKIVFAVDTTRKEKVSAPEGQEGCFINKTILASVLSLLTNATQKNVENT